MPVVKLDSFLTADVINGRIETVEMAEDGARDDGRVGGGGVAVCLQSCICLRVLSSQDMVFFCDINGVTHAF